LFFEDSSKLLYEDPYWFCSLEDNRINYSKSISLLGLCPTYTKISTRKFTSWPCNNFVGQCIISSCNCDACQSRNGHCTRKHRIVYI
jgi:hypothetical protein